MNARLRLLGIAEVWHAEILARAPSLDALGPWCCDVASRLLGRPIDAVSAELFLAALADPQTLARVMFTAPDEAARALCCPPIAVPVERRAAMPEHALEPTFFSALLQRSRATET